MGDIANKDEASKCLDIAKAALQAGNLDKAARFADKAMKLFPNDEVRMVLRAIRSRQGGPSTSSASAAAPTANGTHSTASSADMRRRTAGAASSSGKPPVKDDRSTPEQRELVAGILRTKNFYEILSIPKTCSDDDIKKAYRKLALKLHPDKNTAPRSDEAFKAVSKAFSCLSDAQKRAAYDRYGEDTPGMTRTRSQNPFGQDFDDFDPNEIFNMFFGGGFGGGRGGHVFRQHFGGQGPQTRQGPTEPVPLRAQLLHLLPILALLVFTFLSFKPSEPAYSLDRTGDYVKEVHSKRFDVPYFVKPGTDYEQSFPVGSRDRARVEQDVEVNYKERLDRRCYNERLNQQRMYRWGQTQKAREMQLPACAEVIERFGNQYATYPSTIYGY